MRKLINYVKQLRWTTVSVYAGFPLIAYQSYRYVVKHEYIKVESQQLDNQVLVPTKLEV